MHQEPGLSSRESGKRVPVRTPRREEAKRETAVSPWRRQDYVGEMDSMFDDLARRFESRFAPFPGVWLMQRRGLLQELPQVRYPCADIIDSGNAYRVLVEVPGIPKEELEITATDREIVIEGEAKTDVRGEKEGFVRRERGYSRVLRRLTFPEPVVGENAEASLDNGPLEVRIPKKAPKVTEHRVPVR